MNFATVEAVTLPDGSVKLWSCAGETLWEKVAGRIPAEYQEVEWIQAGSGIGVYFDLGFTFDTAARIKIGMYLIDTNAAYLFGAAENSGKYRCMISAPYNGTKTAFAYGSNGSSYLNVTATLVDGYNDLEYTLKAGNLSVKNVTNGSTNKNTSNVALTMTSNMYLFAQNYNGNPRYGAYRKVSYFQYYDKNDTLICDLVPCYRKSDNIIGMYDIVRKTFLTKKGSGSFTKGPDIA